MSAEVLVAAGSEVFAGGRSGRSWRTRPEWSSGRGIPENRRPSLGG